MSKILKEARLKAELKELRRTKEAGGLAGALRAVKQLNGMLQSTKHQRFNVFKEVHRWAQSAGNMQDPYIRDKMQDPYIRDKIARPLSDMAGLLKQATDLARKVEVAITVLNSRGR